MPLEKDKAFQMRVSEEWLARIDDWRRKQPSEIPSRAEAVRQLVEIALSAEKPKRGTPRP